MRGLSVVCALGLAAAAASAVAAPARPACGPAYAGPTQRVHYANLDRDGELEAVVETIGGCPRESAIALRDRCGGKTRYHRLPGLGRVARLDLVEANGRNDGPELLFGLRPVKRHGSYRGNVGLVHYAARRGRCARPVYLLSYFLRSPPRRAPEAVHFQLLRSSRSELRLLESFGRRLRETRFRYVPRADRYRVYRVRTTKA